MIKNSEQVIVAIHQPNYFPWLGFFAKLVQCDYFVLLDNVNLSRGGYTTRTRIKGPTGEILLTIPCERSGENEIRNVMINDARNWRKKHLTSLYQYYNQSPYFEEHFENIKREFERPVRRLAELNERLIRYIACTMEMETKIKRASDLDVEGSKTELLVDICCSVGGSVYISGSGGANYQEPEGFSQAKLDLQYSTFNHPVYRQRYGKFIPGLSVVDALFNCGELLPILSAGLRR